MATKSFRVSVAAMAWALAACSNLPVGEQGGIDIRSEALPSLSQVESMGESELIARRPASEEDAAPAWDVFGDPELDELMQSVVRSPELAVASARVRAARAVRRSAGASLFPSLNATFGYDSETPGVQASTIGLQSAWTVDLSGQGRLGVRAADARVISALADTDDVERLVRAELLANWISYAAVMSDRALNEASEARLEEALAKVERLVTSGYATALDRNRSVRQLQDVKVSVAQLTGEARSLANSIDVLRAAPPGSFGGIADPDAVLSTELEVPTVSADELLQSRADLRASWARLQAAAYDAEAAKRRMGPAATLSGRMTSTDFGRSPLNFGGLTSGVAVSLVQPLLFRGQLLAERDLSNARLQEAAADYERNVYEVLADLDTAQKALESLAIARREADRAQAAAALAVTQSRRLFDAGEVSYLNVLFAEQSLVDSERRAVAVKRDHALAWVGYTAAAGAI